MALKTSRRMINEDIPEDVICNNIFPHLPFKLVTSLKAMSRFYRREITNNAKFAAIQATLCPSCPALIHIGCHDDESYRYSLNVLSSTPATVGVPSVGLDFLGCPIDRGHFHLLASSNGLLCICYTSYYRGPLTPPPNFFIVNPATQEVQPIPGAPEHLQSRAVGLVFDPSNGPIDKQKFMIVQASPFATPDDSLTEFHFVIFSSDTGRWVMSDTLIYANVEKLRCEKVVYGNGVLYWDFKEDLLWFDVTRNVTGSIKMPWNLQGSNSKGWEHHTIDVSINGMLMCTSIDMDGLAMYQLVIVGDNYWELKHKKGWKDIIDISGDALHFCHSMKLRNGWQTKLYERWLVKPLSLESGRWVYLGVRLKWKRSYMVLCYDMDTGKVDNTGKELGNVLGMKPVFGYRNSMAALPQIAVPKLQDGICDANKSNGCICAREEPIWGFF